MRGIGSNFVFLSCVFFPSLLPFLVPFPASPPVPAFLPSLFPPRSKLIRYVVPFPMPSASARGRLHARMYNQVEALARVGFTPDQMDVRVLPQEVRVVYIIGPSYSVYW